MEVTVTWKGYHTVLAGLDAYTTSDDVLSKAYETLSASSLRVEKATGTKIRGTVHAQNDGVLYSSIPANAGWRVYIDGEEAETFTLDGALLCCDITAGEHEVAYRYRVPGLGIGIAVSVRLFSWAIFFTIIREKIKTECELCLYCVIWFLRSVREFPFFPSGSRDRG